MACRSVLTLVSVLVLGACGPSLSESDGDDACTTCDAAPPPVCNPGAVADCYSGVNSTLGVGECHGGTVTCDSFGQWGPCLGEVTPGQDVCGNGLDENCNGAADDALDADGDGFTNCDGDCCDDQAEGCLSPALVNPGGFEATGNQVDDDCDGTVDNAVAACDSGLASNASDAMNQARAMDLCQTATENPGDVRWGVISARYALASGSGTPDAKQRSIRTSFGATAVQAGAAMAVLSSGNAAATGQTDPVFAAFQPGAATPNTSAFPAAWLAAHDGTLPNAPGCPPPTGTVANDPILLELRIRTPTNARSFRLSTNFLSAEFPEWTCSPYNDFFVMLLDSTWDGTPANPADRNLAIYTSASNQVYPVGVNLAHGDTGLFTVCNDGDIGCAPTAVDGTITTCNGVAPLTGTGFDVTVSGPSAWCDASNKRVGGGTGWLTTSGNVNGGEIITLQIAIWDTSDHALDSVALIDNFQWSVEASEPGTVIDVD